MDLREKELQDKFVKTINGMFNLPKKTLYVFDLPKIIPSIPHFDIYITQYGYIVNGPPVYEIDIRIGSGLVYFK